MKRHTINLFMWGYQPHYRGSIERLARDVLAELGTVVEASVLLVGARRPDSTNRNPVCVEPEDGKWPLSLFSGLLDSIEVTYRDHDLQNIVYGDEPSMRDKPEVMRRDSVTTSVMLAFSDFDAENKVRSFCGQAMPVGDYYVTPVIQVPEELFQQFPPLANKPTQTRYRSNGYRSMIHAALSTVLEEASEELIRPDPGRHLRNNMRSAEEITRIAAKYFMHTPGIATSNRYTHADLFDRFNLISSLLYEGTKGVGRIVLASAENESIDYMIRFRDPVPFREHRWSRKVLQMATADVALIADSENIYGLGKLSPAHDSHQQNAFTIDFLDHYHWELRCGKQVLLRSRYGIPKLPHEVVSKDSFVTNYARLFPTTSAADQIHLWDIFSAAIRQGRGSMIVVAEDAASEAHRLAQQGTSVEPTRLTEELLYRVSGIDGTIILDPYGNCHAIGVILDGTANEDCTPSRGSRFNSAVRYIHSGDSRRLAIVVSEDRTVDLFPMLRPRINRQVREEYVAALETATHDNYHKPRKWLDTHRFYLNAKQCSRINATLDRLDALPLELGEIYLHTSRFQEDPEMNDTYLID